MYTKHRHEQNHTRKTGPSYSMTAPCAGILEHSMGARNQVGIGLSDRPATLIKKKIKFSSYIRKSRVEQLQSHIWLTASSYMGKYFPISSYIKKPLLIYVWLCNCSTLNFPINEENFIFFFISARLHRLEDRYRSYSVPSPLRLF